MQGRVLFHQWNYCSGVDWGSPHAVRLHGRPRVHGLCDQSQWEGRTTVQRGDVELFIDPNWDDDNYKCGGTLRGTQVATTNG